MASTNSTANLELSQFVGTDKPDWLTDYNGDMEKIDAAYGAVNATAEEAASNAESAAASAAQAAEDAAEAIAGIAGAVEAAAAATQAAEQATSVSTSALSVANGAAATAQSAAADAQQALQVANNAKVTAENAQAAAAQSATQAASAAADAATAQAAATQAATDAASAAAIASGVDTRVTAIEECVPTGASSSDKFAVASDVSAITELIPATASTSNKLATVADIPEGGTKLDSTTISALPHVTADGTKTWTTLLSELASLIDFSKVTNNTRLYFMNRYGSVDVFSPIMAKIANNSLIFVTFEQSTTVSFNMHVIALNASITYSAIGNSLSNLSDISSNTVANEAIIAISY